ncbi:transcriptional activator protein acu [Ophiostoma piceae UAMH 11346]|uniref:Transcriptional activator protein acu n=1 Tax=Ophiostoma piceae (strain UAMH 11346) TaxID=1262450 RepID=S3C675_OPHP1|nr:transcriptional activator protein acu [Ophiostoma piceae UAMH 11346]
MAPPRASTHMAKRPRMGERTMLACITCKQKKLKCDGQSPKCQNCIRSGNVCLVEDPATGLQRPRDYMQSLEARVAYLEGLLQQVRPEVATDHFHHDADIRSDKDASIHMPSPEATRPLSPHLTHGQVHGHGHGADGFRMNGYPAPPSSAGHAVSDAGRESMDVLSSEVALLCLSAAGREPHYFGPSSAVSFSRIASATMGVHRPSPHGQHGGNSRRRPTYGSVDGHPPSVLGMGAASIPLRRQTPPPANLMELFPDPATAARWSQAYWQNIHLQYPFLHRPTVDLWERQCALAYAQRDMAPVYGMPLLFVLMVYSIGLLALGHFETEKAETYYALALDHLPSVLELDSLESIQSILCCAVYSIRSHVGASLWKISGLAIRHCVELGYHRSAEQFRGNTDTLTKEMSKRCFWVAYDIDRVAAFILGRPVGIPDDAIDVELPLDVDDEYISPCGLLRQPRDPVNEPLTNMSGAIHAINLRKLWSKISSQVYPTTNRDGRAWDETTIMNLRQELEQWRASSPDRLELYDTQPLSVWASQEWFNNAFDYSILLLYRHHIAMPASFGGFASFTTFAPPGQAGDGSADSLPQAHIERALDECLYYSRDMCLNYRRLYQKPSIQFTWGSLHILFLGGLTYLYCLWRSARLRAKVRRADVASTCMACTTVLVIIAERWNLATVYRDIFEALSERTISMMCGDAENAFLTLGGQNYSTGITNNTSSTNTSSNANTSSNTNAPMPATSSVPLDSSVSTAVGSNETESTAASTADGTVPLQDWMSALDDIGIPQESEWLVRELLQGVRQYQPDMFLSATQDKQASLSFSIFNEPMTEEPDMQFKSGENLLYYLGDKMAKDRRDFTSRERKSAPIRQYENTVK